MTFSPSRARQKADAPSHFLTGAARTKNESCLFARRIANPIDRPANRGYNSPPFATLPPHSRSVRFLLLRPFAVRPHWQGGHHGLDSSAQSRVVIRSAAARRVAASAVRASDRLRFASARRRLRTRRTGALPRRPGDRGGRTRRIAREPKVGESP